MDRIDYLKQIEVNEEGKQKTAIADGWDYRKKFNFPWSNFS